MAAVADATAGLAVNSRRQAHCAGWEILVCDVLLEPFRSVMAEAAGGVVPAVVARPGGWNLDFDYSENESK